MHRKLFNIITFMYIYHRKIRDDLNHKMHFGRVETEDERKLKVLDDVLDTKKYLNLKFSCGTILQGQECIYE